ncbi:MAG: VWA domain-containing protein, partial [Clostridia bacterium]|nr:VWA domain-containing protein [Clostridia bacterium]
NIFSEQLPATVDALRAYDQVILNDIADKDLPEGFDVALQTYVKEYGGGLFTLGGSNEDGSAHAYNKDSTNFNPIYHNMLPVEAVRYTPPIGVMFVIDSSGSMLGNNDYGTSIFESAKAAALACLDVLYDRDYVGIMTLDTNHATILELTPRTQETKIKEAIGKLESSGGNTVFGDAVENAGLALRDLKNVAKRHIIVISDGKTEEESTYLPKIKDFYEKDGITFSVIGVAIPDDEARAAMKKACATGHGRFYEANSTKLLVESVKADLNVPKIEEVNNQPFAPIVNNPTSPLVLGLDRDATDKDRLTVKLGGFYGSRLKDGADLILVGEYAVPIYAQWKYGSGMVGSFLCDLQNTAWSSAFMQDENGQTFVKRAVNNLMPMQDLRPNDISVNLSEDNYTNTLSVFGKLGEGESIKGELVKITPTGESSVSLNEKTEIADDAKFYTTGALTALNKYSRCTFVIKEGGMYAIRLTKYDKEGKQVGNPYVVYKSFSYSEEYDEMTLEEEALKGFLTDTTTKSGGALIEDLTDTDPVVEGFVIELVKVFDPRTSFMIAAIVLFLLDIIVCKFKFKWIHEIIRDKKRKDSLR